MWWDRDWYQLAITLSIDTGKLDWLRPGLSALMTYRVAADLLEQMFPIDAGTDPETLRRHTLRVGKAFADRAAIRPETSAPAITVTLDSTFIRSCEDGERHLEVRVGNVETKSGARQVFGAVAKTDTNIECIDPPQKPRRHRPIGSCAELTAFTDGCPGLSTRSRRCRSRRNANSRLVSYWSEGLNISSKSPAR